MKRAARRAPARRQRRRRRGSRGPARRWGQRGWHGATVEAEQLDLARIFPSLFLSSIGVPPLLLRRDLAPSHSSSTPVALSPPLSPNLPPKVAQRQACPVSRRGGALTWASLWGHRYRAKVRRSFSLVLGICVHPLNDSISRKKAASY